jgi:hypothetical protein
MDPPLAKLPRVDRRRGSTRFRIAAGERSPDGQRDRYGQGLIDNVHIPELRLFFASRSAVCSIAPGGRYLNVDGVDAFASTEGPVEAEAFASTLPGGDPEEGSILVDTVKQVLSSVLPDHRA